MKISKKILILSTFLALPFSVFAQENNGAGAMKLPASLAKKNSYDVVDVSPKAPEPLDILNPYVDEKNKEVVVAQNISLNKTTLESLLSEAYENNPDINSARDGLKAVDEQLNQANLGYMPSLDAVYQKQYDKSKFNGSANSIKSYPDTKSLNLKQGLFGGGETYYSVESAKNRVMAARSQLSGQEQQFLLDSITAYINLIYTHKVYDLSVNNQNVLEQQLKATNDRLAVGDATKTDRAQSEARLANARSAAVIANGEYINAQAEFQKIFGEKTGGTLLMPAKLPDVPENYEKALELVLQNNPQLNQAKYILESRKNDIDVQASQLYPQVDLNGSVSSADIVTATGMLNRDNQNVGVTVTVPLYDKGIAYSKTREASERRNQSKQQYYDTVNSVKNQLTQAWQKVLTTKTNIEATKSSLVASEFALNGVKEEHKEGARTVLDVLDAEQEKFSAETAHARAIRDSVIAIYSLKSVLGELTPSELGLSVANYNPEEHYKNTRFKLIGF